MQPVPGPVVTFVHNVTTEVINPLIAILFAAAMVYFLYGLLVFILNAGNEAKRTEGKSHLMWGLIGMTIMVSTYAILAMGLRTVGVTGADVPNEITPINL